MKLANIFGDNMVFQAGRPVRFFGTGSGSVAVVLNGEKYEKQVDEDTWLLELPAQNYGGAFDITVELDGVSRVLHNVAFGDVILCAGQSNMHFSIDEETDTSPVSDDLKIRYFASEGEATDGADGWGVCRAETVGAWSALGLHIAQSYRKQKDVFVGIVGCSRGSSGIRTWLPPYCLDQAVYVPLEERHNDYVRSPCNKDSLLYNVKFTPIVPFCFKCVVWYQGESDTTVAECRVYTQLLARLITAWRTALRDDALPFVIVEICDYDARDDEGWHCLQECQREIVNVVDNASVVASRDVCEHAHIHPENKEALAARIAQAIK